MSQKRVRRTWISNPRYQIQFAVVLVLLNINVGFIYLIALNYRMRELAEGAGSLRNFLAMDAWSSLWPAMLVASAVSSVAVFLIGVRYSNQIVGPLTRVTRAMEQLAHGSKPPRLKFRPGDVFEIIAENINQLSDALHPEAESCTTSETSSNPEARVEDEDDAMKAEPVNL
jgi:methyl-accepting chemotaxis protein